MKYVYLPFILQGEYGIVYERIYPCKSTNWIQYNLYFNKKISSITEMKINFTFKIPVDDNFTVRIYKIKWVA